MLHTVSSSPRSLAGASLAASVVIFAMLVGGCGKTGAGNAQASETPPPSLVPIQVAPVQVETLAARYSGTATLETAAEAQVVAKATGIVRELRVEEGDRVEKGQLLARLDDADARNELAQAEATLKKFQAKFDRAETAVRTHLIPQDQYEQDKYDLETQRAVVAGAQLQLSYTRVVAPISGVIARRDVKAGNLVQANASLFRIVDMDPLLAVLNVPERELGTLRAGQPVTLRVDALADAEFSGEIERIAPVVDPASGTFRVTCRFSDSSASLRPGMFARISIVHDEHVGVATIPRAALLDEDGDTAVFVVGAAPKAAPAANPAGADASPARARPATSAAKAANAGKPAPQWIATRRSVKVGYADGDRIEIREGLAAGDRVVTVGRNALRDGAAVQVLEDAQ
jgi:membrane fusion protein (multidrug efflux system)